MSCKEPERVPPSPQDQQIVFYDAMYGSKTVEEIWLEKLIAKSFLKDPPITKSNNFNEVIVRIGSKDRRNGHRQDVDKVYAINEYVIGSKGFPDVGIIITKEPMVFYPHTRTVYQEKYVVPLCLPKRYAI